MAVCPHSAARPAQAAELAYLDGAKAEVIAKTIVNTLGICSGMVCDGAKSSCAAKIAAAVEAGLDGYEMAKTDLGFVNGEGIIGADVEQTIFNVGRMARQGLRHTDEEILNIMLGL